MQRKVWSGVAISKHYTCISEAETACQKWGGGGGGGGGSVFMKCIVYYLSHSI